MQNKIDGGLSCLQEIKWLDTACHIDSMMHDLSHNHFFSLLVSSMYCRDLVSLRLAVCHIRVIKGKKEVIF